MVVQPEVALRRRVVVRNEVLAFVVHPVVADHDRSGMIGLGRPPDRGRGRSDAHLLSESQDRREEEGLAAVVLHGHRSAARRVASHAGDPRGHLPGISLRVCLVLGRVGVGLVLRRALVGV